MQRCSPLIAAIAVLAAGPGLAAVPAARITILYDNAIARPGVQAAWGFACLVEAHGKTVLFDTGGDPAVLRTNLTELEVNTGRIEAVAVSHFHGDHTLGAPGAGLMRGVEVLTPRGFECYPEALTALTGAGLVPVPVDGARAIHEGLSLSVPLPFPSGMSSPIGGQGAAAWEQALLVDTPAGVVVIVGCAHPGILTILDEVKKSTGRPIHMVIGGFHLLQTPMNEISAIAASMRSAGVGKAGPTHCSGDDAMFAFRRAYGDDFVRGGVGTVIEVAAAQPATAKPAS